MYKYIHNIYSSVFLTYCTTENGKFRLFAANRKRKRQTSVCSLRTENGNGKLPFLCCKRKQKTEVYFPWLGNDRQ